MLKQALKDLLDESEISKLSSAFDVIGDIAIIKIPAELSVKEGLIAEQILKNMKNVKTVLRQESPVQGEYRTRNLAFVGGEKKFETIYKESGCRIAVNVEKVYFSPRLSTERLRIASLVKDGEMILNMFAGVGTFSFVIAKKKHCVIDSVDKNEEAIRLAVKSLEFNRKLLGKVVPVCRDASEFAFQHKNTYDRVLMPLPERSREFLPAAIEAAKSDPPSVIHYYVHVSQEEFQFEWIARHLEQAKISRKYEIQTWKKVREVGPRYIQAVADILLL